MIIASIDIMEGKAVQLRRGRKKILERENTIELARHFHRYGEIAVIDLDAAMERGDNREAIRPLLRLGECRIGGGIRTVEKAREWISLGATKVIVGTAAFAEGMVNIAWLTQLERALGRSRIIVAVDALGGEVVSRGWRHRTGVDLFRAVRELEPYCGELLFTCVQREGTMQGIDLKTVRALRQATDLKLTVAGGVASLDEIKTLAGLGVDVQLGMALYKEKIDLAQGFIASLKWGRNRLLPTIVQNEAGQVLMLAYSSPRSLAETFRAGRMVYYSRSRKQLWLKGETSGSFQDLQKIRADCDRDTLLATVRQHGAACHSGEETCFGRRGFTLHELAAVIDERLKNPKPGSYTASLDLGRTREKLREEVGEIIKARKPAHVVWEAADVLYFLLVYLRLQGIGLDDVLQELSRRRKK